MPEQFEPFNNVDEQFNSFESVNAEIELPKKGKRASKLVELSNETLDLPISERSLVWGDLPIFSVKCNRTTSDIVYDLALLATHDQMLKKLTKVVLAFELEFLVRVYYIYPQSCDWKRPKCTELFELLYGDIIRTYPLEFQVAARMRLGIRFVKMAGRASTAQYRWIENEEGNITRRMSNLFSKIKSVKDEDRRLFFERISRLTWKHRGVDIDLAFPMPTLESLQARVGVSGRKLSPKKSRVIEAEYAGSAFLDEVLV